MGLKRAADVLVHCLDGSQQMAVEGDRRGS